MPELQANLNVRKQGDICVVEFQDRKILEEVVINQIGERLSELADSEPEPKIILDFRAVEHLSSAALGMLITLNRQVVDRRGKLALANIHPQIFEVFKITRLNKLFNIQSTTEDAVKAVS